MKSQGGVGLYKQDPRGCVVLQLLFYSVHSYTASSQDLTDDLFVVGSVRAIVTHFGVCGDLCNDGMQSLGFVQQLLPLWAFIALFRYFQGLPFLLEALLTLTSVNW